MTGPSEYPRLADPERDSLAEKCRQPPHNIPVEQALLGAILVNNEAFHRVSGFLLADHFFEPVHGRIYEAMSRLIERQQLASPITLAHFFERDEGLKDVGGAQYLARLAASMVSVLDTEDYGRTTFDLYQRRALISAADGLRAAARDPKSEQPAIEILQEARAELDRIDEGGPDEGDAIPLDQSATRAVQLADDIAGGRVDPGQKVELADVDRKLGGLKRARLYVLAGRTSMGKSAVAVRFAERIAMRAAEFGAAVLYFSLEMSADELANRVLAARTGIPYQDLDDGRVDAEQIAQLTRAQASVPQNLLVDETESITLEAIRARAMRRRRKQPIALLVVDHIGLMAPPRHMQRMEHRHQIGHFTKGLKALAKEIDAPVLALSQLNREADKRDDKRPRLTDLRESGTIEQDADVVLFVFREEYYLDQAKPRDPVELLTWQTKREACNHVLELIVAKKRGGGTGIVPLYYDAALNRFGDLERHHAQRDGETL